MHLRRIFLLSAVAVAIIMQGCGCNGSKKQGTVYGVIEKRNGQVVVRYTSGNTNEIETLY